MHEDISNGGIMKYLDFKLGVCGVAFCQIIPPMCPKILALHEQFQRAMFAERSQR
jgi:hypothetical protein